MLRNSPDNENTLESKGSDMKSYPSTGLDRPLKLQEIEAPRISRQSAQNVVKVVTPMHQPSLPSKRQPWYSFVSEAELIPGPWCDQK